MMWTNQDKWSSTMSSFLSFISPNVFTRKSLYWPWNEKYLKQTTQNHLFMLHETRSDLLLFWERGGKTDQPDLIPPILTSYPDVAKTFIGRLTSSNIVWSNLWKSWKVLLTLLMFKLFVKKYGSDGPLGTTSKKNPSYSVTLSLKVGGGQDEITLIGVAKIVTS